MQEQYDVILTKESIDDVTDIRTHIFVDFGMKSLDEFDEKWESEQDFIADNPYASRGTDYEYRGLKIYKRVFKPSLIFYTVQDDLRSVIILRVLREERDWEHILETEDEYHF